MSYRKIEVNGKQYEYVVGKMHTKIKTVGIFKNEDIGEKGPRDYQKIDIVHPRHIAAAIKAHS